MDLNRGLRMSQNLPWPRPAYKNKCSKQIKKKENFFLHYLILLKKNQIKKAEKKKNKIKKEKKPKKKIKKKKK
jgi:hypothetical protein